MIKNEAYILSTPEVISVDKPSPSKPPPPSPPKKEKAGCEFSKYLPEVLISYS